MEQENIIVKNYEKVSLFNIDFMEISWPKEMKV